MLRGRWRSRPDLVRIFVAVSVVVGIIVLVIAGNTIVDKAMRASDGGDRMQIWRASLQAVRMSPWLGWGLGSFADIYAIVQPMQRADRQRSCALHAARDHGRGRRADGRWSASPSCSSHGACRSTAR